MRGASNALHQRRQRQWAAAPRGYIQRHIAAARIRLLQRHGSHRRTNAPQLTSIMYISRDPSCIVLCAVPAMPCSDEDSDRGWHSPGATSRGTLLLHSASPIHDLAAIVAQAHLRRSPACTAAVTPAALSRVRCQQCLTATKTATVGGTSTARVDPQMPVAAAPVDGLAAPTLLFLTSSWSAVYRTQRHTQRRRCGSAAVRNGTRR